MTLASELAQHGPNCLSTDSLVYQKLKTVVENLTVANRDIPELKNLDWRLHVVDRKDIENAFVIPTGDIFVFTGFLEKLDGTDELGVVLGHEMAHAVLSHDVEKASLGHVLDLIFMVLAPLIWLLLPSDLLSFITQYISERVMRTLTELPYSRKLEEEADLVGLELAAKACYDVRKSSKMWTKLYLKRRVSDILSSEALPDEAEDIQRYFSTHPLDLDRADSLDLAITCALDKRKSCNCPPLPHVDPRHGFHFMREMLKGLTEEDMATLREDAKEKGTDAAFADFITSQHAKKMLLEQENERNKKEEEMKVEEQLHLMRVKEAQLSQIQIGDEVTSVKEMGSDEESAEDSGKIGGNTVVS